jgi:predicted enzyme related to lactoylglutathione lyase
MMGAPMRPSAAAVVFVDDVQQVSAFYQALAGMTLLHADSTHAVLALPGLQLTVHAIPGSGRDREGGYPVREDTHVKLCFPVDTIARARATASDLGGEVWPPDKEWDAVDRGFRACDGRDPEGNVFQVREALSP